MGPYRFVVEEESGGMRLDKFLAERVPGQSRATVQRHIQAGAVLVDGRATKPSHSVRPGEVVTYDPPKPKPTSLEPQPIPLEILYEDEHIVVLNKPAGLVVHPAAGHPDGTLVNALLAHCPDLQGIGDVQRPGIVHRLDRDTSGVMLVAKTALAHRRLVAAFSAHALVRVYLAVVRGTPPSSGVWRTPYGRHPRDRKRFTSRTGSKQAGTRFLRLATSPDGLASLLALQLETGRTHQVRVHCFEAGYPILGDPVYKGRLGNDRLRRLSQEMGRQALHAAVLGLRHPVSGRPLLFLQDPPEDLLRLLRSLSVAYPPEGWPLPGLKEQVAALPEPRVLLEQRAARPGEDSLVDQTTERDEP